MNIIFKKLLKIIIILEVASLSCHSGNIIDVTQNENLTRVIESEYKRLQMPGIACVSLKVDSIMYMVTKGYADRKTKKAINQQTRMMVASVSKTVVVTAIMQLFERGLIELDEDINNYLPFSVRNPNFPEDKITIKMLLTHTSSISIEGYYFSLFHIFGYVDYPESIMSFAKNYLTRGGQYYTERSFLKKRPGSCFSYSNPGVTLLGCIVEYVSKTDFNSYCKDNIFKPLGMTRTTWLFSETPKEEIAIPYSNNNLDNSSNPFYTYPTYPAGHLITTAEDLSIFLRAYIMGGTFNGYQLLHSETVDLILQEYGECGEGCKQGLIFYKLATENGFIWGHSGGDFGVSSEMYFNKEQKNGYIMLNNRTDAYSSTIRNALLLYSQNN
jgi:CubicO group peptidase (beta-lactamase class C family)